MGGFGGGHSGGGGFHGGHSGGFHSSGGGFHGGHSSSSSHSSSGYRPHHSSSFIYVGGRRYETSGSNNNDGYKKPAVISPTLTENS